MDRGGPGFTPFFRETGGTAGGDGTASHDDRIPVRGKLQFASVFLEPFCGGADENIQDHISVRSLAQDLEHRFFHGLQIE